MVMVVASHGWLTKVAKNSYDAFEKRHVSVARPRPERPASEDTSLGTSSRGLGTRRSFLARQSRIAILLDLLGLPKHRPEVYQTCCTTCRLTPSPK